MSASGKDDPPKPSGRVRHDSGGRAVWEWAVDSGRHAVDSTSALLKKLELSGLRLMDDKEKEAAKEAEEEVPLGDPDTEIPTFGGDRETDPHRGKRGFNPYNSRLAAERKTGKPTPPPKPRITQPVRPAKKPGFFARLFGRGKA
jgi:hypothetical protein